MTEQKRPGRPRKTQKQLDTTNETIGQESPTVIRTDIELSDQDAISRPKVEVVEGIEGMTKAEELIFMEEIVEIVVLETTDRNMEPIPEVGVNGRKQYFIRGLPQKVKRKFVNVLAGSKRTNYSQTTEIDQRTGHVKQSMNPHKALQYPFNVIHDPNPKGAEWLRRRLADPN